MIQRSLHNNSIHYRQLNKNKNHGGRWPLVQSQPRPLLALTNADILCSASAGTATALQSLTADQTLVTCRLPGLMALRHCIRQQIQALLAGRMLLPMHFSDLSNAIDDLVDRELAKSAAV